MLWRFKRPSSAVSMMVETGPTSRTTPSIPATLTWSPAWQALANVVARQDAADHIASAQPEKARPKPTANCAERDQNQVLEQLQFHIELAQGREEGKQGQHVIASRRQPIGIGDPDAVSTGRDHAPEEARDQ